MLGTCIRQSGFPDFYLSHIYQSDFCQATFTHRTFTHQDFYLSLVLAIKKTSTHQFETFTHQSFISSITNEEQKREIQSFNLFKVKQNKMFFPGTYCEQCHHQTLFCIPICLSWGSMQFVLFKMASVTAII